METYKEKISSNIGFTLIELLVTVTIVGILASVGLPSFSQTIRNNRLTTNINELVTSMSFARNEAVKRNQSITVLRNGGAQWESGWIVFTDLDEDGVLDAPSVPPAATDDTLLRTYGALPANYTLRTTANLVNRITFRSSGLSNSFGSFVLCDNSDGNNIPEANTSRAMTINNMGRTRMGGDIDNNFIPELNNPLNVLADINSCVSPFN